MADTKFSEAIEELRYLRQHLDRIDRLIVLAQTEFEFKDHREWEAKVKQAMDDIERSRQPMPEFLRTIMSTHSSVESIDGPRPADLAGAISAVDTPVTTSLRSEGRREATRIRKASPARQAEVLRIARRAIATFHFTQEELALAADVAPSTVEKWRVGYAPHMPARLRAIDELCSLIERYLPADEAQAWLNTRSVVVKVEGRDRGRDRTTVASGNDSRDRQPARAASAAEEAPRPARGLGRTLWPGSRATRRSAKCPMTSERMSFESRRKR